MEADSRGIYNDPAGGKMVGEDLGRGAGMQTFTGGRFYPADPRADEVDIVVIAQALSTVSRYGGHCHFYSVAEHSVIVSKMVPPEYALHGLLHDATEAYIADVIRPVKRILGNDNLYFELERRVWRAVAERFRINEEMPDPVKIADLAICGLERRELHPRAEEWDIPYPIPEFEIFGLMPYAAATEFLWRACQLGVATTDDVARYNRLYLESTPRGKWKKAQQ